MNTGAPSRSSRDRGGIGALEFFQLGLIIRLDPAADFETARLERHRQAVFGLQPLGQHVELQRADDADDRARAVAAAGTPARRLPPPSAAAPRAASSPSSRRRASRGAGFPGAKLGTPRNTMSSPSVSVSPMRKRAVIGNADDVAGIGLVGERAVLREEELRRVERPSACRCAPASPSCRACSLPEQTRMKAMRSRWLGSMFAWILNTKPVIFGSCGIDRARVAPPARAAAARIRRARRSGRARRNCLQRAAEKDRRQMALEEGRQVERLQRLARELDLLDVSAARSCSGSKPAIARIVGSVDRRRLRSLGIEPAHGCCAES